MKLEYSLDFAKKLDAANPLTAYRDDFYIPELNGKSTIYFAGNGIGLQPKKAQDAVLDNLEDWASYGVVGMDNGRNPWKDYYKKFPNQLAPLLGALPEEIVVMDQLTANLHLLLTSFYRPDQKRKKVIIEWKSFSSDVYALQSQMQLAGVSPEAHLIEVKPKEGSHYVSNDDIVGAIEEAGEELALVLVSGVNYYTGQVFDMEKITRACHKVGAVCGVDLAHAVGNIGLDLHKWKVDFAVWCSYKYLNAGPGAIGGLFVHQNHFSGKVLPRLAGLFGSDEKAGFQFKKDFIPMEGAAGWQLTMPPVLSLGLLEASLDIFESAGFENIQKVGKDLTSYLIFILKEISDQFEKQPFEIITPVNEGEYGQQISILLGDGGHHQVMVLRNNGVIVTHFPSNVVRIAPVPLYNTFEEVFLFGKILEHALLGKW